MGCFNISLFNFNSRYVLDDFIITKPLHYRKRLYWLLFFLAYHNSTEYMFGGLFRLAMTNTIGIVLMIYLVLSYPALLFDIFVPKTALDINIFGGMFRSQQYYLYQNFSGNFLGFSNHSIFSIFFMSSSSVSLKTFFARSILGFETSS